MIRSWSSAPVLDIRDFLNAVIFNMLVGNADAHGKNYSLLYQNGSRRLAPAYDIVCTLAWPELSKKPAMKIGQCDSIDAITPAHWQKMTQEASLSWPPLRERLVSFCQALQTALPSQSLRQATGDDEMYKLLTTIVDKRVTTLLQALT
jgi:serine/threonine-protein kinase HipA